MHFCNIILCLFLATTVPIVSAEDEFVSVIGFFRHGERNPTKFFPNDPFKNLSLWPEGLGQLSKRGKQKQYVFGKWLRKRYKNFLPTRYSSEDFYIRSSDMDRCLESGALISAGLYPPKDDQIWNSQINWQPIPIHTVTELEDGVCSIFINCPKYTELQEEVMRSKKFLDAEEENKDFYALLREKSGANIDSFIPAKKLFPIVAIEKEFYSAPEWMADPRFDTLYKRVIEFESSTEEMTKLKRGPLLQFLFKHFSKITQNQKNANSNPHHKLILFIAHDFTVSVVLKLLKITEFGQILFGEGILFEIKKTRNGKLYIELFFKSNDKLKKLDIPDCPDKCSFEKFINILKPYYLSYSEWRTQCDNSTYPAKSLI